MTEPGMGASYLKNQIKEQSETERKDEQIQMEEDTLVSDDHNKCSSPETTEIANNDAENRFETICQQLNSIFLEIKEDMKNKNLEEAKQCLEKFRIGVNSVFGDQQVQQVSSYQMKKIVKDFNSECDKIRMSKNTVYNYRKCISDNMETLIKQIISIQKNEVKKIKANQKPNHKRKNRNF